MVVETMRFLGAGALADKVFGPADQEAKDLCFDPSRDLLFLLVQNQQGCTVEGFRVREGTGITSFCTLRADALYRMLQQKQCPGVNADEVRTPGGLVALCPGPPRRGDDHTEVHLILLSGSGMRIFLRTITEPDGSLSDQMELVHVAAPPTNDLLSRQLDNSMRITNLRVDPEAGRSFLTPTLCVLHAADGTMQSSNSETNAKLMVAMARSSSLLKVGQPSAFQQVSLRGAAENVEAVVLDDVDSEGLAMRILSVAESGYPFGRSLYEASPSVHLNELASQHDHWPRELLVLMEDGLQSYLKLRPVDWLAVYLQHDDPSYHPVLLEMFEEYGRDECCAMCYSLACTDFGSLPRESVLRIVDVEAVRKHATALLHGGMELGEALVGSPVPGSEPGQQGLVSVAGAAGLAVPQWTRSYSDRFNGLRLYAARLLGGVWEHPITRQHPNGMQDLNFSSPQHWKGVVAALDKLIELLQHLYPGDLVNPVQTAQQPGANGYSSMIEYYQDRVQHQADAVLEAQHAEISVVFAMYKLLQLAREGAQLFFRLARIDTLEPPEPGVPRCRFVDLVGALDPAEQRELSELSFRQLVTKSECRQMVQNRKPVFRKLVQQLVLSPSHRELAAVLKVECPSFFGHQDHQRLQADEMLTQAARLPHDDPRREQLLEMAVSLYREVGRYIERDIILDNFTGLPSFGLYAATVELIVIKARSIPDQIQRDEALSDVVDVMNQVWQRKMMPERMHAGPRMSPEAVDREWKKCLSVALDLGQPKLLRDNGAFHCTLYDLLFQLQPPRSGHDELIGLPAEHYNLVQGTLFQYLEREHREHLFRAYRAAGLLQESAEELFHLSTETSQARQLRNAEQAEDLVETRILWLAQATLDLQGMGMRARPEAAVPNLLAQLQERKEVRPASTKGPYGALQVLQVQKHVRDAIRAILQSGGAALSPELEPLSRQLELEVCDTTVLWQAVSLPVEQHAAEASSGPQELWKRERLFRECLLILELLEFERENERFNEQVRAIWSFLADCRDNRGMPCTLESASGAKRWRDSVFHGITGSVQHISQVQRGWALVASPRWQVMELRPHSAVFPLDHIILAFEQKHMQAMDTLGLEFEESGWVAQQMQQSTRASYQELHQAYMYLLRDPRLEWQLLQVHLLGAMGLLLRGWLASPLGSDQNMLQAAHIDFDEIFGVIDRNQNNLNPQRRERLRHLFRTMSDQLKHLKWY